MSIYGTVCDALMMVFVMDEEIESQLGNKEAANCPGPLRDFLKNHA